MTQFQNSSGSCQRLADGSRSNRNKLKVSKDTSEAIWTIFCSEICDRTLCPDTKNLFSHENFIINAGIEKNGIFMKNRVFKCPDKVSDHNFSNHKSAKLVRKGSWTLEVCFRSI